MDHDAEFAASVALARAALAGVLVLLRSTVDECKAADGMWIRLDADGTLSLEALEGEKAIFGLLA